MNIKEKCPDLTEEDKPQFYTSKNITDVNSTQVFISSGKTIIYGQTPKAVCRDHFTSIARKLGMPVDELAQKVIKMTQEEKLDLLAKFYAGAVIGSEDIYTSMKNLCTKATVEHDADKSSELQDDKEQRENGNADIGVVMTRRRKRLRKISSSSSGSLDSNAGNEVDSNVVSHQRGVAVEHLEAGGEVRQVSTPISASTASIEEFEAFLFGKSSPKKKPPPFRSSPSSARNSFLNTNGNSSQNNTVALESCELQSTVDKPSPSKVTFVQPAITFDPSQWSLAPQRSMLDIVKDLSKAKQLLENGKIPSTSVSFI